MEQRRCYGCMELTDQPVCPNCGSGAVANAPHQLPAGSILSARYLVGKALWESAEGITYLALDQAQGRTVNLLEYYPAQNARREGAYVALTDAAAGGKTRFVQVSRALAGDQELAEITGVRDSVEENGTAYRVSEQIRGTTLYRYVRIRGGVLDAEETLRIVKPVLGAMAAAHRVGVAHGGIRMDTIVLDPMGGARLGGFGDSPAASPQEDVLALCRVILGCLIQGGEQLSDCPDQVPGFTAGQCAALKMGMVPNPKKRFASAGALYAALFAEPQIAGGPAVPPVTPEFKQKKSRKKLWIGLGAGVGALVLVFLALLAFGVHIWMDADCTHPRTCLICGKTEGDALGHDWAEAGCDNPKTCQRCGEEQGKALGHAWREATCLAPKTCENCGATEGSAVGHSWEDATCEKPKTCKHCGATEGKALGHAWQAATYSKPKTCSRCGETEGDVLGYHESVPGSYDSFYFNRGTKRVSGICLKLDEPVIGCRKFTLEVEVGNINYGTPEGSWKAFYRNTKGEWVEIGDFTMTGTSASATFTFNSPVDIESVTAVCSSGVYSFSVGFAMVDVYAAE